MSENVATKSTVANTVTTTNAPPTHSQICEPAPCVPPIRDLWRRSGQMGLNRAIANVVVQRLRPNLSNKMGWPLDTSAMGKAQRCFIFPTIPPQGHWFTLSPRSCDDVANAAAEETELPPEQRSEIVLLAVWRSQRAGADRRLHTWAIPAHAVALMANRLDEQDVGNRNVGIEPPSVGRPSVWRKGKGDPAPIPLQDFYRCWTLSDSELTYVQEAQRNEIRPPRESRKRQ